jgi:folylpolyglutamate synthase/dihydropteroate synthase
VATSAEPQRSLAPDDLAALAWASGVPETIAEKEPLRALALARAHAAPGDGVVITGSIFLAGALRPHLLAERARP